MLDELTAEFLNDKYDYIKGEILPCGGKVFVKVYKECDSQTGYQHCGIITLDMSKRIMNEVMCLAEDIKIPIYYQDTDSMQM